MRNMIKGLGAACCLLALSTLGACSKNSDGGCCGGCGEKAALGSEVSPSMVKDKSSCSSKCEGAKSCGDKSAEVSPAMVSESKTGTCSGKKSCSSSCAGKQSN